MSGCTIDLDPEHVFYQRDTDGQLRPVKGADVDVSQPFFSPLGDDADHDQGDVCDEDGHAPGAPVTDKVCGWCGEGVGEWIEMGYHTPDLAEAGQGIPVSVEEVRRVANTIEVLATAHGAAAERIQRGVLDGVHIAEHRAIPRPVGVRLPEALGGVPADAPEQERYRLNRADRRRLAKRGRRG